MDVFAFTFLSLINNMLEKFSITMILSLQRDNPDIPRLFKSASAKGTYQFAYENNKTLVSYKPENDKKFYYCFCHI